MLALPEPRSFHGYTSASACTLASTRRMGSSSLRRVDSGSGAGAGEAHEEEDGEEEGEQDEGDGEGALGQPAGGQGGHFRIPALQLAGEADDQPLAPGPEGEWGGGRGEDALSMTSGDESLSQADEGEKHYQADFRCARAGLASWDAVLLDPAGLGVISCMQLAVLSVANELVDNVLSPGRAAAPSQARQAVPAAGQSAERLHRHARRQPLHPPLGAAGGGAAGRAHRLPRDVHAAAGAAGQEPGGAGRGRRRRGLAALGAAAPASAGAACAEQDGAR
jgi:hypothetical protein